jgi:co-chaperonin GroES (HSP10)
MKPIGKWIVAKALIGGEKTTAAGIIFQEKSKSRIIPAKVLSVGNKLTEDIKVGISFGGMLARSRMVTMEIM